MTSPGKSLWSDPENVRAIREAIAREKARRDIGAFCLYTNPAYKMNWHHRLLCDCLNDFVARRKRRIMVFMPPRHGKSELVSRNLPAYILGKNPDAKIIATSYSADLAQAMNRDVQRIIDGERYAEVFPDTELFGKNIRTVASGSYLRNSDIFEVVGHKGQYRGAGVGGGITGMGGDYIIIDDPIKNREEANSATYRQKLYDWYTSTLYTRLEKDGCVLITLTRWHEDDLAGRLLGQMKRDPQADQWDILSLPAIAEDTPAHPLDPRSPGEALWEGKYSINALSTIKATIGTYDWSAMYQQSPQPAGGAIFKREWMNKRYKALPAGAKIIQSWDLPFKASASSAKCAGIVMARKGAELFFCDCVNDKMEFNDTVTAIKSLTAKWPKARGKVIEDKANGPAIVNFLEKDVPGMIRFNPHGSKEDRALSVTPYFEAGNVYFPEQSADNPWVGALIDDLIKFPGGTYKDTVDATVQAILYLMDKAPTSLGTGDAILRRQSYWKR